MKDVLINAYPWIKALHVFSVILWMSAQLTLPLLLGAHRRLPPDSDRAELLAGLERRLVRRVLNPAILAAFLFGGMMVWVFMASSGGIPHWLMAKLALVVVLSAVHGLLVREYKRLLAGRGSWSGATWGRAHGMDIALLATVVALVMIKPAW